LNGEWSFIQYTAHIMDDARAIAAVHSMNDLVPMQSPECQFSEALTGAFSERLTRLGSRDLGYLS
jgi:hypothetical protein